MSTAVIETRNAIFEEAFASIHKEGVRSRYANFIGGKWVAPILGKYFAGHSPINGEKLAEFARSSAADVEIALRSRLRRLVTQRYRCLSPGTWNQGGTRMDKLLSPLSCRPRHSAAIRSRASVARRTR
jgi:hypothetical protein